MSNVTMFFGSLSIQKAAIFSFFVALLYYSIWYDDGNELLVLANQKKIEISALNIKIIKLKKIISDVPYYNELKQRLNLDLNKILEFIPKEFSENDLKTVITKENDSNEEIEFQFEQASRQMHDFYEEIKIPLTLKTSFNQIMIFFSDLTKMKILIHINRFNISRELTAERKTNKKGSMILNFRGVFASIRYLPKKDKLNDSGNL